jgi:outer membrane receptor for ferric coprogen and ferric-rhodotorulic acid
MYFQNQQALVARAALRRSGLLPSTIKALLLAAGMLCVSAVVQPTAAQAQSQESRRFEIPAGPLTRTLGQFAAEAGVSVAASSVLTEGKTSAGLSGNYSVPAALAELLQGTQLEAIDQGDGAYVLQAVRQTTSAPDQTMRKVRVVENEDPSTEGTGSLTTSGPVTAATGLGLSLRETPQSITVITRERIEQQNLTSLAEIAEQVPGVHFNSTGTPVGGRTWLYSRGYSVNSYQIDGVNVPWETVAESEQYGHGALDTAIYDSVTVVRGSTGLMTGTGEPSALMALTRKKPTLELQSVFEVTAGSWNRHRLMADVGGPLNDSGSVRARVVGAYDEGDTWVDNYSSDRSILYGALEADLGARTLMTLTLEHGMADSRGAPWAADYGVYFYFSDRVTPIPPSTTTNIAPYWSYLNSDRTYVSAALEHRFSDDWKGRLSYGFGKFNTDMRRGMVRSIPQDGSLTAARVLSLDYNYDTHIVDLSVDGTYQLFGRAHEVVAGFNMYRNDQALPLAYYGDPFPDLAYWGNGQLHYDEPDWDALVGSVDDWPADTQIKQSGAYLATRLHALDRLALTLGGRVTHWKTFATYRETSFNDYSVWDEREYSNEFTPYAGVVVDLTAAFSAYASYTQIFKPQDTRDVSGSLLDPEEGNTYEVGLKGEWFEGRLNASAAAFESKRNNLAVALEGEDGPILTPNGEQAHRAEDHTKGRGWELEVAGELTPSWQIQAGYARFKNEDSDGNILDTTQPEQQFKLFTAYTPAFVPKLTVGASLRWQDDTYVEGDEDPLSRLDSYFVVGANVDYALNGQVSISLLINNLLDEEYRVSNYYHSYGAPLNATFNLRARF